MEFDAADRHWIFELKYARQQDRPEALLVQALKQIQIRRYGDRAVK
ncbi:MAG: hypothetical protein ACI4SV_04640 [Duodenibacillus sp.]